MKVDIAISARHIHLSKEDFDILFPGEELVLVKPLSEEPNYSSDKTVTLKNGDRSISNVRVVGPFRNETQVELSKTDCYTLKIDAPLCNSGSIEGAASIEICNEDKSIVRNAAIIQNRHIHISEEDAKQFGFYNDQVVRVKIDSMKGGILDNVHIKMGPKFKFELHLDTDDGNAFLIDSNSKGEIIND